MRYWQCWSSVLLTLVVSLAGGILTSCSGATLGANHGGSGSSGSPTSKATPTVTWAPPAPITNPSSQRSAVGRDRQRSRYFRLYSTGGYSAGRGNATAVSSFYSHRRG
jgi:hypothetical protein